MIFVKPDGREIEVNERSAEHALSLGWKPKDAVQEFMDVVSVDVPDDGIQAPKRRGRPPKVKHDNDSSASS